MRSKREVSDSRKLLAFAYLILCFVFGALIMFVGHAILFDALLNWRTVDINYFFYDSVWYSHWAPMAIVILCLPGSLLYWMTNRFPQADLFERLDLNSPKNRKNWQVMNKWLARAFLLSIPFIALDALNYSIVTQEGVEIRKYASMQTYKKSWDEALGITTGCYRYRKLGGRRGMTSQISYTVVFDDNFQLNLFNAGANGDKFDQMEEVDNILKKLSKPAKTDPPSGIRSVESSVNRCVDWLRAQWPDKYWKIIKLLRLESHE